MNGPMPSAHIGLLRCRIARTPVTCMSWASPSTFLRVLVYMGNCIWKLHWLECFMAKDLNGPHRPAHQVWRSKKISITFDLQGMRMMLSECQDCGIWALGEDSFQSRQELDKNAATHQNGWLTVGVMVSGPQTFLCVCSCWICVTNFVCLYACGRQGRTTGGATEPTGHNHAQWQCRSATFMYIPNLVSFWVCSGCQNFSQIWRRKILSFQLQ